MRAVMGETQRITLRQRLEALLAEAEEISEELKQAGVDANPPDPGRHRQRPKLRLIKGGLVLVGAAAFVLRQLRDHTVAVAVSAGSATVGVATGAALMVGEMPAPAAVAPPAVSTYETPYSVAPSPRVPGTARPPSATPRPAGASTPTPSPAATMMSGPAGGAFTGEPPQPGTELELPPLLEPLPTPVPTLTPTPNPTPTVAAPSQAEAVHYCLSLGMPPQDLDGCVDELLGG